MNVSIVNFPETRVALLSHKGPPEQEHETVMKLVQWKIQHGFLDPEKHRHYGLHYLPGEPWDPSRHQVDFCLSIDGNIEPDEQGIVESIIPACRCALARDIGSRLNNQAMKYLVEEWLPGSNEAMSGAPAIFHYVNVGPDIRDSDAITDVYLPLA